MQTHEKKAEDHHVLALELGQILLEMNEPEQAQTYFSVPFTTKLDKDVRLRVAAAEGQLRYHQWYLAWTDTLARHDAGATMKRHPGIY